jgi:hypothetical protein
MKPIFLAELSSKNHCSAYKISVNACNRPKNINIGQFGNRKKFSGPMNSNLGSLDTRGVHWQALVDAASTEKNKQFEGLFHHF